MKYILILVMGFALGIYVDRYQLPDRGSDETVPARISASQGRDAYEEKIREWRLTPEDIRRDLAKTGEVVRTQARAVGGTISDARIVTIVKAKYILDRDLSSCETHVSADHGRVALSGSVGSPDLIGRAVALALDTDGVTDVSSKLAVAPH